MRVLKLLTYFLMVFCVARANSQSLGSSIAKSGQSSDLISNVRIAPFVADSISKSILQTGSVGLSIKAVLQTFPSADSKRLAQLLDHWSNATSLRSVNIDVDVLSGMHVSDSIAGRTGFIFDGTLYTVVDRRDSLDHQWQYLTLEGLASSSVGAFAIDLEKRRVVGWLNTESSEVVIRPLMNVDGVTIGKAHLILERKPTITADDLRGVVLKGENKSRDLTDPSIAWQLPRAIRKLDKPLTIYMAYTNSAYEHADHAQEVASPVSLMEGTQGIMHQSFLAAGVDVDVQIVFAEVTSFVEPTNDDLETTNKLAIALQSGTDEALRHFRDRRTQLHADIGVLVLHRPNAGDCGDAGGVRKSAEQAMFVVNWQCIGNVYSPLHELGHVLGAFHEDGPSGDPDSPSYARAYIRPDSECAPAHTAECHLVTVMGQLKTCGKDKCHRVSKFSSPIPDRFLGVIGSTAMNNAQVVAARLVDAVEFGSSLTTPAAADNSASPQSIELRSIETQSNIDRIAVAKTESSVRLHTDEIIAARVGRDARTTIPQTIDPCPIVRVIRAAQDNWNMYRLLHLSVPTGTEYLRSYDQTHPDAEHQAVYGDPTKQKSVAGDRFYRMYVETLVKWAASKASPLRDDEWQSFKAYKRKNGCGRQYSETPCCV